MKCSNRKKIKAIKLILGSFIGILFFISSSIWANGNGTPTNDISSHGSHDFNKTAHHKTFKSSHTIQVKMFAGSVRANVERIARANGWRTVVWKSSEDYYWRGTIDFKGTSLSVIMGKILSGYPLQANFYQGNHVLVIQPRTLK